MLSSRSRRSDENERPEKNASGNIASKVMLPFNSILL
jgi:hypothetical protein